MNNLVSKEDLNEFAILVKKCSLLCITKHKVTNIQILQYFDPVI